MNFVLPTAKGKVVNIYRETYKCPECAISEEHPDDQHLSKPVPSRKVMHRNPLFGSMHQKYQNGLPLNRQEEDWKQLGVLIAGLRLLTEKQFMLFSVTDANI